MFRALLLVFAALLVLIGGLLGGPTPAHALLAVSSTWSFADPAFAGMSGPDPAPLCASVGPGIASTYAQQNGWTAGGPATLVSTSVDLPNKMCVVIVADTWGNQYTSKVLMVQGSSSCPAHSSAVTGGCQCDSGYQEQGSSCVAIPQCTFGTTVKSGYFDYGKDPAGAPPTLVCAGGCSALFFGDVPAGSALVDGTKHWFAKGSYQMSGGTCDPSADGTAGVPTGTGSIPSDSCGSNQTQGTVTANGKTQTVCVDKLPDDPSKAGQPAPTNEVNESKGSNTTINITNNADGSKTIVTTTINNNGNGTTTKTTTTETKDSSGQTTGSTTKTETAGKQTDQQQQQDKCQQNSSAEGCGGSPKDVGGSTLYTAKDKTAASVLSGAKDTIMGSGIGSAMGGFFAVAGGGSCTGIHGTVTVFDRAMSLDSDVFCSSFAANAFLLIRAVILVLAAWWAFRIAVE